MRKANLTYKLYNLATTLAVSNAYIYGGLIALTFYYRIVKIIEYGRIDQFQEIIAEPLSAKLPELFDNKTIRDDLRSIVEEKINVDVTTYLMLLIELNVQEDIKIKSQLVPTCDYYSQLCQGNFCSNLFIDCANRVEIDLSDTQQLDSPLQVKNLVLMDTGKLLICNLHDLLMNLAIAIFENQSEVQIPNHSGYFNRKTVILLIIRFKAEILMYLYFIRSKRQVERHQERYIDVGE